MWDTPFIKATNYGQEVQPLRMLFTATIRRGQEYRSKSDSGPIKRHYDPLLSQFSDLEFNESQDGQVKRKELTMPQQIYPVKNTSSPSLVGLRAIHPGYCTLGK